MYVHATPHLSRDFDSTLVSTGIEYTLYIPVVSCGELGRQSVCFARVSAAPLRSVRAALFTDRIHHVDKCFGTLYLF